VSLTTLSQGQTKETDGKLEVTLTLLGQGEVNESFRCATQMCHCQGIVNETDVKLSCVSETGEFVYKSTLKNFFWGGAEKKFVSYLSLKTRISN
jgi:hypothetical protein